MRNAPSRTFSDNGASLRLASVLRTDRGAKDVADNCVKFVVDKSACDKNVWPRENNVRRLNRRRAGGPCRGRTASVWLLPAKVTTRPRRPNTS